MIMADILYKTDLTDETNICKVCFIRTNDL
jgi:hypothetical protein